MMKKRIPTEIYMREPRKTLWSQINNSVLVRFLLFFASGWAFVQLISYFETVIVIFAFAAISAFVLSYPVRWLRRFLPRSIAVILVFSFSLANSAILIVTVGLSIFSQAQQLIGSVTAFLNSLVPLTDRLEEFLLNRNIQVNFNLIQQELQRQILAAYSTAITYFFMHSQVFFTNFITLVLIATITFFILLDGQRLWLFILRFLPKNSQNRFSSIVQRKLLGFIQAQLILILFMTTSSLIIFLGLQVPFALILAVILGTFSLIPGIGTTLGVSLVSLIALSQGFWLAVKILGVCILLQQIQDNLIVPRVMQDSVNINPIVTFFAILVGVKVAGIIGIFLSIPIAGVIVSFFEIEEMKAEQ